MSIYASPDPDVASDSSSGNALSFQLSDRQYFLQRRGWVARILPRWRRIMNAKASSSDAEQKRRYTRRLLWSSALTLLTASIAIVIWLALILTVANRLRIPHIQNGLQQILQTYHAPNLTHAASPTYLEGFSDRVIPVQCHSHNDYWHRIPLYEGLAAGCISTEADIWVGNTTGGLVDLFVGHSSKSLSFSRTLRSLYLDPLLDILAHQNSISANTSTIPTDVAEFKGVFSVAPNSSLVLLLDFKTGDDLTWKTVESQLDKLRTQGWLTHWTPQNGVISRPLTIVASGAAPFDSIIANTTYRDIFYDAPITQLSDIDNSYNSNNSFYASGSLPDAVGTVRFGRLSVGQKLTIAGQINRANELNLKSRYWNTLSWPVGWRNRIWDALVELGESVLNTDDLIAAARWDWQMCVVAGVNICNN